MRFIDNRQLRRLHAIEEIEETQLKLNEVVDEKDRNQFLTDNATEYRKLSVGLWTLGCCKCWYSEATLIKSEAHVEHYRPQKRLCGLPRGKRHNGYWWRAFDWRNLRYSHTVCNRRVTDHRTKKLKGKGSYFPVRDEANRATCAADEHREEPLLLDPTVAADCKLLCFNLVSGTPEPRYKREDDEWRHRRARESIDFYFLDEPDWDLARMDIVNEVNAICDKLNGIIATAPLDQEEYDKLVGDLLRHTNAFAPFSSIALQAVREKSLLEELSPMANA